MKGIITYGGIAVAAVFCGLLASRAPWQMLREQKKRTSEVVNKMRKSEDERERLLRLEARYLASTGMEELARQKGYVRQNEKHAPDVP